MQGQPHTSDEQVRVPHIFASALKMVTWSWWHHQMETFSMLLAICAGNSLDPGEFPAKRPVTWSFDVFFVCTWINGKQSWGWWFEMPLHPLWHHSYGPIEKQNLMHHSKSRYKQRSHPEIMKTSHIYHFYRSTMGCLLWVLPRKMTITFMYIIPLK